MCAFAGAGPDGVEEIKRHEFFNTIDWNVSVSANTSTHIMGCLGFLTFAVSCRNSSAGSSTRPSNQLQDGPTTRSISIQSSLRKPPEVQTPVAPPPLHIALALTPSDVVDHQQLFLCLRLSRGSSQCKRPSALQRVQFCGHNRRGHTAGPQHYCSGAHTLPVT